jgi:predicted MFS family arabinose efflux permease
VDGTASSCGNLKRETAVLTLPLPEPLRSCCVPVDAQRSSDDSAREGGDALPARCLRPLAAAAFVVFFQIFMVAPLIPRLAEDLGASPQVTGLVVPAYMIPYGLATLAFGLLSDRLGRRRLMLASLALLGVLTAGTATAGTVTELIVWRVVTGLGAAGVVPLTLALIGATYPFERRGRPLGWVFAAMAGGMAFGSSLGALAEPLIGWRGLFVIVGVVSLVPLAAVIPERRRLGEAPPKPQRATLGRMAAGFRSLLASGRGRATYGYVALNSVFHAGVYTWFGAYFVERHGLGEAGIALAIIGYGVPGFLFGPWIGRAADRWGRRWLLPVGLAVGAAGAAALAPPIGVLTAAVAVLVVSLGYDLTQPLLAGIVTDLGGPERGGQAMGLNVFVLFTGFGLGAVIFGELLRASFTAALVSFAVTEMALAAGAVWLFAGEGPRDQQRDVASDAT